MGERQMDCEGRVSLRGTVLGKGKLSAPLLSSIEQDPSLNAEEIRPGSGYMILDYHCGMLE